MSQFLFSGGAWVPLVPWLTSNPDVLLAKPALYPLTYFLSPAVDLVLIGS